MQFEKNLYTLFNTLSDLLFVMDGSGNILMVNETVSLRLGYAAEELVGSSFLMVQPAERRAETAEFFRRMTLGKQDHGRMPLLGKDGKVFTVDMRLVPGRWDNRDILLGVCRDASAGALSEEKFFKTFHATAALMALSTFDEGRFIDVNETFLRVLGFSSREQVIGKTIDELGISRSPSYREGVMKDLVKRGTLKNYEVSFLDRAGNVHHGLLSVERVAIENAPCLISTLIDITDRKKIEEVLQERETNFRTFFETLDDLILVGTRAGRIRYANPALSRKVGYTLQELTAMDILDLHPPDSRQEAEGIFAAMLRGERELCPLSLISKGGRLIPVETRIWFGTWDGAECIFGISKDLSAEREAQQRFERLFQNNPAPMALSSIHDLSFAEVNDSFLSALGYTRDEVVGKTNADLRMFADPGRQEAAAAALQRDGRIDNWELQVRRKDGGILHGLFSGEIISSRGGQYFFTVMLDITDRKRAEEELALNERRYRQLASLLRMMCDNVPDMIWAKDLSGRYLFANRAICENLLGARESAEPIGKTDLYFAERERGSRPDRSNWHTFGEICADSDAVVMSSGQAGRFDEFGNVKGNFLFLDVHKAPFRDEEGSLIGTVGCGRDVTRERQLEQERREAEEKYRSIFIGAVEGIFQTTADGRILSANPALAAMYGYNSPEDLMASVTDIGSQLYADAGRREELLRLIDEKGEAKGFEARMRRKDGTTCWVSMHSRLVSPGTGAPAHYEGFMMDITERKQREEALYESEARWKFALEGAGDGVWDWDATTNRVYYSRRWKTMLGYSEQEIGGTLDEWDSRVHPDDRAAAYADIQRHFRGETDVYQNEHRVRCKDGTYKWIFDRGKVITWTEDGKPLRVIGTHTDITDRKQAEEALQESRKRYQQLFELESDALFLVDKETYQILDVNQAAVELYGYSREELLGMKNLAISAEPERTRSAIKDGISDVPVRWHRKKDGTVFPVEITGTYLHLGGKMVHLSAVRDNTERMAIEEALRNSENRYHLLFETAADGLFLINRDSGRILDVNDRAVEMYGFDRDHLLKLKYTDLSGEPDESRRTIEAGRNTVPLRLHRKKGGTVFPVEISVAYFQLSHIPVVFASVRDITERVRSEGELARHRSRLEELVNERTKELENKTQALQEVNAALKVLLQQRDADRRDLEARYVTNIENLVLPYLEKLKKTRMDERQMSYLDIMQTHFSEIVSPLLKNLQQFNLTPAEARIASLIKEGKSTKEISEILMVATGTIDNHRKSIRKKLGLNRKKANLQGKLNSIDN